MREDCSFDTDTSIAAIMFAGKPKRINLCAECLRRMLETRMPASTVDMLIDERIGEKQ